MDGNLVLSAGRTGYVSRKKTPVDRLSKVLVDRGGALLAILLLLPVFAFVAAYVKLDGGTIFFGHTRIGQNGKPFKCWKFRSMVVDAESVLQNLLASDPAVRDEWEREFKLKNDPRITKIGHFLRKSSLDELPQFFNVLKGEMSLVGPRPIVSDELKYYGDSIHDYHAVRPGVTGLWQVSGRNDISYMQRVNLDSWYVNHWSFWNDIVIIFKTVGVMLNRKGAY